ncbi:MAG: hypothetical protein JW934_00095 [Anaerolineae bacterium]|nr:hypothetical protein [Anaerolineae bacterium]
MTDRKFKIEATWRDSFSISDQDIESLFQLFVKENRPLSSTELTRALIEHYCQQERALVRRNLSGGAVYRPNGTFAVGETLIFPHLNFAKGIVRDVREGNNPEYGDFRVITAEINREKREFAAELKVEHKLAFADDVSFEEMFAPAPETVYEKQGDVIKAKIEARLNQGTGFALFRSKWMAVDLMAEVSVGYLNLAEAVLEIQDKPLNTESILPQLGLPSEIPLLIRIFSLNYHLARDDRFTDVGANGEPLWGLRRWLPQAVISPPDWLNYTPIPYDRTKLDVTHLQLEREIDDEYSRLVAPPSVAEAPSMTLTLSCHHRRLGSLPLTDRTKTFFPAGTLEQRTQITFVDHQGKEFPGWVVHSHKLVYGLSEWYKEVPIPAGAYIKLEKTGNPNRVKVDVTPRRMRREWAPMIVQTAEGRLEFQMQKVPIVCEYDEAALLEIDPQLAEVVWKSERTHQNRSLEEVIQHVFLEIAKLSSHGTVHAKTLYNGVNIIRRCPPGRIFATLFELPHFVLVEGASWMFNQSVLTN